MKRKLFLLLCALLTSVGMWANQTLAEDGVYYIQNVETGLFLSRGGSYGAHAIVDNYGLTWRLTGSNGSIKLQMYDIYLEGFTSGGLGDNSYVDNGSPLSNWTLEGDANGYTIKTGSTYLTASGNTTGSEVVINGDGTGNKTWILLSNAEHAAFLAAKTSAQESAIATAANIDLGSSTLSEILGNTSNWKTSNIPVAAPTSSGVWDYTGNRDGDPSYGDYGTELYNTAGKFTKSITGLSNGIYKITVRAMHRSTYCAPCWTVAETFPSHTNAYVLANGAYAQLKDWKSAAEKNGDTYKPDGGSGTADFKTKVEAGYYATDVFAYVSDGNLNLTIGQEGFWYGGWFVFNGVTVTYYDNSVSDDDINALIETIPSRVSEARAEAMNAAKTTLLSAKTIANYNALSAAIEASQTSASEYAIIDAGTVPTNSTTGWAISTTNGELACNTWSAEGNTDGSGMTTPFVQDWVSSGTALAGGNNGKLYYKFTDLTPGEEYAVTARIRVFNESGTGVTGATYYVGNDSKSIETYGGKCLGSYANTGLFAVLSCVGTVDENGDLEIGVNLDSDSPINWISIKDVTIAESTDAVPTAISLDKTSGTLNIGLVETLTPTLTPSNADDKTILWTSSDETVATVSGGKVVALKAGTATITATACASPSVNATYTVTVAAAAPSYYSNSIEATDYYIMNVATGRFLGGANSWGTQASLIEHGIPFTAALGSGVYTLDSHTYNNETDHFLNGTYVDGGSTDLYITSLGSGKFSISTADGSAYLSAKVASTIVDNTATNTDSPLAQWYFLSKSDRDKMLATATAENPVDATYYIKEADISRNLAANGLNNHAWTGLSTEGTQNISNFAGQVYNATVNVSQTIENIPNGTYELTMQGFSSGTNVKLHANNQSVAIRANTTGAITPSAASAHFANKECSNTVTVTVTNNTLTISLDGDCSSSKWLCYDNFELYCKGLADIPVEFGPSGFATFACDFPVTLPVDESIKGYTASIEDATINFNKLTDKLVPANTGVMLSGTANTTMYLPVVAEAEAQSSDFIRGTGAAPGADDDYYFFAIKKSAAELTFGTFDPTSIAIAKNKAYFKISKGVFSKPGARLVISFDDEDPTGINAVEAAEAEAEGLKDGKYLIDNKIVLVKNGVKYSANGQILK